ncbi:MAG: glycosyltransferase family 2 protein [Spirochaetia bacterium]|nr:glycosyltransferase family 2 protein [Spirochaetia bacterium]
MTLSVIMPAYRAEKYIGKAISSIQEQKGFQESESEFIVVDDGSDDSTVEKALGKGARVIRQEHKGAAAARNRGLKEAKGDFILLLDADDMLAPDSLSNFMEQFEKNPELDACFALSQEFFSEDLEENQKQGLKLKSEPYGGTLPGCSLIRHSVFDRIGLFDETLRGGETVDWMVRFRSAGFNTIEIPVVTLQRRIHASNTGRLYRQNEMANYAKILRAKMRRGKNVQDQ